MSAYLDCIQLPCPFCNTVLRPKALRTHTCERGGHRRLEKQNWHELVDEALVKAGYPPLIYGYSVDYLKSDGSLGTFIHAGTEAAARRKARLKSLFKSIVEIQSFSYERYCQAFGIPGSRM